MHYHSLSLYIQLRRFRRRLKSKEKKKARNKKELKALEQDKELRIQGKTAKSFADAFNLFMPSHLRYIISVKDSPLYYEKFERQKYKKELEIAIPKNFSITDNPDVTYACLRKIASAIFYQSCSSLWLDYSDCESCDLATQVFLDSILIDNDRFIRHCARAKVDRYLRISSVGGRNINNVKLQQMINSVGSPVELINRRIRFTNIIPYRLRHIDGSASTAQLRKGQKELDTTDLIQYVLDCLSRFNRSLSQKARQDLGNVVGEIISNAEEHSTLHNRYLIGYMDESRKTDTHYGILNLVMMNTGGTIYEKFKYPSDDVEFNTECLNQMRTLSDKFKKKNFFRPNAFTEENLWTLYTLQGGVSCIPPSIRKRGNGTIEFIDSFFKLKGSNDVDDVSCMSIISGNTEIDFDGTYRIKKIPDSDGHFVGVMSFNESGNLEEKPNSKYVYHIKNYFPGTIICAKLLINEDDLL